MTRNKQFVPEREPLRHHASLQPVKDKIDGPLPFLNPTQAQFQHTYTPEKSQEPDDSDSANHLTGRDNTGPASNVAFKWTSRNNRKGRHALVVKPQQPTTSGVVYETPSRSSQRRRILQICLRMFTYYPVWDISWWVAYVFTWGSVLWVLNGFFVLLPSVAPSSTFPNEVLVGGGVTAFIGATVFEIGSVLLMFEAVNENKSGCFGWAVERLFEEGSSAEKGPVLRIRPDHQGCTHHHRNKKNFVGKPQPSSNSQSTPADGVNGEPQRSQKSWRWFPSAQELRTHYLYDLGFLACSAQFTGATVFWISGFTALPGINNVISHGLLDGIYWTPQVVGGFFFMVSGFLFMIETQKHWWLPALDVLGWHIGLWNFIGAVGFFMCGCMGYDLDPYWQFQAGVSSFWGSWAFLIGSVIQLYESLEKDPVEFEKTKAS